MHLGVARTRINRWILATLVAGLLLTALATLIHAEQNKHIADEAFDRRAKALITGLEARLHLYEEGLDSARGALFAAGESSLNRSQFHQYALSREIESEFPGARGFGIIRRVHESKLAAFIAKTRASDWPQFDVHGLGPPVGDDRYIIQFIEPIEKNRLAIGFDISTERHRFIAANAAMRSGQATLTSPIRLMQEQDGALHSLLFMLPFYRNLVTPAAPLREQELLGWTYCALSLDEVLSDFHTSLDDIQFVLSDVTDAKSIQQLFVRQSKARKLTGYLPHEVIELPLFGRLWRAEMRAEPTFIERLHQTPPLWTALAGLLLTALTSALVGLISVNRERAHAIVEQKARLATIVENSPDAIIGQTIHGQVFSWNQAAERLFGYAEEEVLGLPLAPIFLPKDRQDEDAELLARLRQGEHIAPFDTTRLHRAGTLIDVSVTACAIRSQDGEMVGIAKLIRNNIERKAAERQLKEFNATLEQQVRERTQELESARRDLRTVLDSVPSLIGYWGADMRNRFANKAYEDWFGISPDKILGMHVRDLLGPELFQTNLGYIESALQGKAQQHERWMQRSDGQSVYVQINFLPDTLNGQVAGFYVIVHDISEVKAAQAELESVAALLSSLLHAATEFAIIAANPEGVISIFNTGAERMLGYSAEEMIGKLTPAIFHVASEVEERGFALSQEYGQVIEGFRVFVHKPSIEGHETREWTYIRKDGQQLRVSLVVTALRREDGVITGYMGIAQDVTQRAMHEAGLLQAKAAAESANQAKSLFLANMSHEIRTPLNAVIGASHLLESTPLEPNQHQLLAKVQVASKALLGVVNDILDLAKVEAGQLTLESQEFNLLELLQDLSLLFTSQATDKGLRLDILTSIDGSELYVGDAMRLRQILSNLLSNALKFTQQGSITLRVEEAPGDGEHQWLNFQVDDTGMGIAPEVLDRLFQPFSQADVSTTRQFGGTGLGLSIVRQLARMMGGEAGASSVLGRGSTFWVKLPFVTGTAGASASQALQSKLKVLIVDDNENDRLQITRLCESLGWRTVTMATAEDMLAYCDELISSSQPMPDALIVDWRMPGMDGLSALHTLAQRMPANRQPASLLVSIFEKDEIEAHPHAAVADYILPKPVQLPELFNAVNFSIHARTEGARMVIAATNVIGSGLSWLQGLNILMVDDSDINLDVGKRLLEREGAKVQTCINGQQAIDLLASSPSNVDLVLMDVQMPILDGYEATRRLRQQLGLHQLPVLALTAGATNDEKQKARAAGMDAFLTKPLEPATLIRTIRMAVEKNAGKPHALPLSAWHGAQDGLTLNWPLIDGINAPAAAQRLSHDVNLFMQMLQRLLIDFDGSDLASHGKLDSMHERILLARDMHKLRGSASLLGADAISRQARLVEQSLKDAKPQNEFMQHLQALAGSLHDLAMAAKPCIQAWEDSQSHAQPQANEATTTLSELDILELIELLNNQDLSARQHVDSIQVALRTTLGKELADQLQQAILALHYDKAIRLLQSFTSEVR